MATPLGRSDAARDPAARDHPGRDPRTNRPTAPAAALRPERTRARRAQLRSWRHLAPTLPADAPELLAPIRLLVTASLLD